MRRFDEVEDLEAPGGGAEHVARAPASRGAGSSHSGATWTAAATHWQMLSQPIIDDEGKLVGVMQAVNKTGGGDFTEDDEKLMKMMGHHICIFIDKCS